MELVAVLRELERIENKATEEVRTADDADELENVRLKYMRRHGVLHIVARAIDNLKENHQKIAKRQLARTREVLQKLW